MDGELEDSDHRTVHFSLDWVVTRKPNPVLVTDYRRANYERLRRHREEVNLGDLGIYENQNCWLERQEKQIDITCNNLVSIVVEGQGQHIPQRTLKRESNDHKWMTLGLKLEICLKKGDYKKNKEWCNTSQNYSDEEKHQRCKSNYEIKITKETKAFFQMYITTTMEKYKTLKANTGKK